MSKKIRLLKALDTFLESMHNVRKLRTVRPIEKKLEKDMQKAFRKQGKLFISKFVQFQTRFSESVTPDEINRLFDNVFIETFEDLKVPILAATGSALLSGGKDAIAEFGFQLDFDLENPRAVDFLERNAASKVTKINTTTRETIAKIVTRGTEEGQSYNQIAKDISQRFKEFRIGKPQEHIQSRAHLVAVTEIGNAYEESNRIVALDMEAMGIQMEKHWDTVGDDKVSDGCQENQAAGWVPINQSFPSVGTYDGQRPPRFPSCRCDTLYRRKPIKG